MIEHTSPHVADSVSLITIKIIHDVIAPKYMCPVPAVATLRLILRAAGIPAIKANPRVKNGSGAPDYYNRSTVENWLKIQAKPRVVPSCKR
jgi:hypothetical protein